ncbi:MAG: alpha-mannosidase [Elainellaceae cyanobacterium]
MTDSATSLAPNLSAASDRISETIQRLRSLTQLNSQSGWRLRLGDLPIAQATQATTWQSWSAASLNDRNHIAWAKGRQVLWLGQQIVVPHNLQGYYLQGLALRLALIWWAEDAQVYVNGKLVQEGDLFDTSPRILLSPSVEIGNVFNVAIRLVSPGHDNGALVRSRCIYERADQSVNPIPEPGFFADELAVLQEYLTAFSASQLPTVANAVAQLPWSVLTVTDRNSFDRAIGTVRQQLQPLGALLKQRRIQLLGHAHLDLAWLWTVSETWQVAERTFQSVLQLQEDFADLTFGHSTPALYAWVEQNRPDLFQAIQAQIAKGRWEVIAGLWIEPELNLISGESIARHVLYGQRYVQEKFGRISPVAWLPDTFGFSWQLPQILKQGGIEFFATQKLRWNDTTQFPYEWYWWQAPDGSQILSLNSAPIGEGIDPVKMAQYGRSWETKTKLAQSLWLPGVGDHGGGPTRDMLETAQRWQRSPFFPQLEFSTMADFLTEIRAASPPLPVWKDELYLEFHRGCYTTHADQKWWNRRCEEALYEAELFSSLATLLLKQPYPKAAIETAWKQVLFNHFHDILPGTSIPPVFVDANPQWETAARTGWQLRDQALQAIAQQIQLPAPPVANARAIVVFNSLNWVRSEVATVTLEQPGFAEQRCYWRVCNLNGEAIDTQLDFQEQGGKFYWRLSFRAEQIPAIGYRCFWLCPYEAGLTVSKPGNTNSFSLENEFLSVTIDPATGNLSRLFDKVHRRDLLSRAGNQLQAFQDQGQYWDAWNIDPKYAQFPLPAAQLVSIQYEAKGAIASRIRVIRKIGQSTFNQAYSLEKGSRVLKIHTQVNWQERHVLVKAAFPLNINAAHATYEIPFGAIQRTTRPQTNHEKAKWEVPALRWADLSDTASNDSYGVSILSDCKHGYDSQPNQIRLTLLRGPEWPDPNADRGLHEFTYAVYLHDRDWKTAQTLRRGYELNQPLLPVIRESWDVNRSRNDRPPTLPASVQFLNLPATNLVLTALKQSEENPNQWLLRCYEGQGQTAQIQWRDCLHSSLSLNSETVTLTNLLEQPIADPASQGASHAIAAWKIMTFRLSQT